MTSCDRSPRNVPALSLFLPHASRALSLDRADSLVLLRALRRVSLALMRLRSSPRIRSLSRSLPGGMREREGIGA